MTLASSVRNPKPACVFGLTLTRVAPIVGDWMGAVGALHGRRRIIPQQVLGATRARVT
jgi:hypothetical protein